MRIDPKKLVELLRKKFASPKHLLAAMGFDEALNPIRGGMAYDAAPVARKKLLEDLEALLQELNLGEEPKKRFGDLIERHMATADQEEKENEQFASFLADRGGMSESEIAEAIRMARGQRSRADEDADTDDADGKGKDRMPTAGAHHGHIGAMDRRRDRRFGTARIIAEADTTGRATGHRSSKAAKAAIGPTSAQTKRTSDRFGLDRIGRV